MNMPDKEIPKYIIFAGMDGVGKTTQIRLLRKWLHANGYRTRYIWGRSPHYLTLILNFYSRIKGYTEYDRENDLFYRNIHKSRILRNIYPFFQLIDMALFDLIKLKMCSKRDSICIMDRYHIDTLVDLMISTNEEKLIKTKLFEIVEKMIPNSSKLFLLDGETEQLKMRRSDLMNDLKYEKKRLIYMSLAQYFNLTIINTTCNQQTSFKRIIENIDQ